MMICVRYGNSCGTPFIKNDFIEKNRQYEIFSPYLKDRPSEEWTDLSSKASFEDKLIDNKQEGGKNVFTKLKFKLSKKNKMKRSIHKKRTLKYRKNK
jgi:hypothetical protein